MGPGRFVALVEEPGRRDETHQPARPHEVERLADEPVVDAEPAVRPVAAVADLVVAERDVRDHQIEGAVSQRRGFEPLYADVHPHGAVQRPEDAPGQIVQFDRRDAASRGDVGRHAAQEVAVAAAGVQDSPALETQAAQCRPDPVDDEGLGVVAVVDRSPGRLVLRGLEQCRQLHGALLPRGVGAVEVEARRNAAPSGEAQQRDAFIGSGRTSIPLDGAQHGDGFDVGVELRRLAFEAIKHRVRPLRPGDRRVVGGVLGGLGRGRPPGSWQIAGCVRGRGLA